jgi:hypothetical protein
MCLSRGWRLSVFGDPVIDRLFGLKTAESLYLIIFTVETPLVL